MSGTTGIDWTHATLNLFSWNCTPVSEECDNCYAETLTNRFHGAGAFTSGPPVLRPARLLLPWTDPKMRAARWIFLVSMSDPFHGSISITDQALAFAMMAADRSHRYQCLTKRPAIMKSRLTRPGFPALVRAAFDQLAALAARPGRRPTPARRRILADIDAARDLPVWPLPNVMLGVSAGTRYWADLRVPILRTVPAAARFVSAEPLLGPVEGLDLTGIDWLITGGESGPRHRPLHLDWARSLQAQCAQQGVAYWFKQVGGLTPKAGGDLLDGRTWKEIPPFLASR